MINKKYFLAFICGLCIVPAVFCMKKESPRKQQQNKEIGKGENGGKQTVTADELKKIIIKKQIAQNNNTNNSPNSGTQKVNS